MTSEKVLEPRAAGGRRFEGKIIVVTGGGGQIGSATARRVAQEGAAGVVVTDAGEKSANAVRDELRDFGTNAISYIGDLTTWETADGLMNRAKEEYGRIDGLANIAGGNTRQKSFWLWEPKEIEWDFAINFWTTMWCCRAVLPIMLEQGSGSIVNIATTAWWANFASLTPQVRGETSPLPRPSVERWRSSGSASTWWLQAAHLGRTGASLGSASSRLRRRSCLRKK